MFLCVKGSLKPSLYDWFLQLFMYVFDNSNYLKFNLRKWWWCKCTGALDAYHILANTECTLWEVHWSSSCSGVWCCTQPACMKLVLEHKDLRVVTWQRVDSHVTDQICSLIAVQRVRVSPSVNACPEVQLKRTMVWLNIQYRAYEEIEALVAFLHTHTGEEDCTGTRTVKQANLFHFHRTWFDEIAHKHQPTPFSHYRVIETEAISLKQQQ